MNFQTLYRARAFSPGADLWVVPEPKSSQVVSRVDWYLNFQLARAELHRTQPLAPELRKIIVENDMGLPEPRGWEQAPLMVAAEKRFPTLRIIEIKTRSSLQEWVKEIETIWGRLGRPRLRVFLPQDLGVEDFQKLWSTPLGPGDEVSLVPN